MLHIDEQGMIVNAGIMPRRFTQIERQPLQQVQGIIVHQTGSGSAASTFNSYTHANANGAHFLIDKDGTIYQTASIKKRTHHVGPLLARCLAELRCKPAAFAPSATAPQGTPRGTDAQNRNAEKRSGSLSLQHRQPGNRNRRPSLSSTGESSTSGRHTPR